MNDTTTANSEPGQPLGLPLNDGLGLVERLRQERRATRWTRGLDTDYPVAWEPHPLCQEAAGEIERLRAALEVSQAATNAAVRQAQWQARTNAELNALQDEVRKLRAAAIRRLNDEFGA